MSIKSFHRYVCPALSLKEVLQLKITIGFSGLVEKTIRSRSGF